ncbi:cytochrome c peroxidase [Pontiella sulfatireligans]|uniref:Cytochrome c551 peroxidase n=1 Tax=Pontiella sulfatireligans TaxID=2750658 RepID=A0A6C2URB7_9BACT|nr:cytochrome c peroxidase [Pontiella sulfatireligans]VGO22870.1 Cytochrome c551 peroxidase [Pontiella sulfatireligans]
MKKVMISLIALGVVGFVVLGLSNMMIGIPVSESWSSIKATSSEMELAKEVIGAKCLMCHSKEPALPFYAKLPVASAMIGKHIEAGERICDLQQLFAAGGGNEVLLAKLEQTIKLDTMPIPPFLALHWNGKLSDQEKQAVLDWIHQVRAAKFSTGLASAAFAGHPVQPLPDMWPGGVDAAKAKLGEMLYNDKRLSGDDTVSCASCHDLKKGGTDHAQFSTGVRNQVGGINAPTSLNAMFNVLQFWDGRAKDLADQAGGPPLNPIEMDTNWEQVAGKLSKDAGLTALYKTVYGMEQWNDKNITDAIAEFERTLITPNSGLDQYLKGDDTALTDSEITGFILFSEHSCATCHAGKAMGGQSFEKAVDPAAYYSFRGIEPGDAEFGRVNATKNEDDRYKLKVPLLRNVALTGPYLHDGNLTDLKEVISIMNNFFVPELNRKPLSDDDVAKIAAMLMKNSGVLNGEQL